VCYINKLFKKQTGRLLEDKDGQAYSLFQKEDGKWQMMMTFSQYPTDINM